MQVFIALFVIAAQWKQSKCPSTEEWINKLVYSHTVEYYLITKKNELVIFATTWMTLGNIILSEGNQLQKPHRLWFHLCEYPVVKSIEIESRLVVA